MSKRALLLLTTIVVTLHGFNQVHGQDPFGGPALQQPAAAPAPKAAATAPAVNETDPIVLAIRESNPQKPDELLFAIKSLYDIGRTTDAKQYIKQFMALKAGRETLDQMHRKYGEAFFYRLTKDHRMQPEGTQIGKAVMAAAYELSHDPAWQAQQVQQLASDDIVVRSRALDNR